jgi:hypothetical protein
MEMVMTQPRITIAGGCLVALLVAGCGGMHPNSTASPLGRAAQGAIGLPDITAPLHDCNGFRVYPKRPVITVNQQLVLSDLAKVGTGYGDCDQIDEAASWGSSRGSRIQPADGGMKAIFSALRPGVYRVHAKWDGRHDAVRVTVTSS